jgi:hypothetical protein
VSGETDSSSATTIRVEDCMDCEAEEEYEKEDEEEITFPVDPAILIDREMQYLNKSVTKYLYNVNQVSNAKGTVYLLVINGIEFSLADNSQQMSHFYETLVDTLDQDWHHFVQVKLPPESSDFTDEVLEWTVRYWYKRFAANHHVPINLRPEFEPSSEAASIILIRIANRALAKIAKGIFKFRTLAQLIRSSMNFGYGGRMKAPAGP